MSLDERLRRGLPRLVGDIHDPEGSVERIVASSTVRRRRRRTAALVAVVMVVGGGMVHVATRDADDAPTEVLGTTLTSSTTIAPAAPPPTDTGAVAVSTTTVPPTTTTPPIAADPGPAGCRAPLLLTALPADFRGALTTTSQGEWLVRGGTGRLLAMRTGAAALTPDADAVVRTVPAVALGTSATVFPGLFGSTIATMGVPGATCARVSFLAQGLTDAELAVVLAGVRADAECSARASDSTPATLPTPVPAAVLATRDAVRAAARACDFEALAAIARANPSFRADVAGVDLADQWRLAEARGSLFMRGVLGLVDLVPRRSETSIRAGAPSYVWPWFAFDDRATRIVDADYPYLDRVYGAGAGARFRADAAARGAVGDLAGTYVGGLFVEIRADGVLAAIGSR